MKSGWFVIITTYGTQTSQLADLKEKRGTQYLPQQYFEGRRGDK